jgi:nicotinate-nucleotide adenylyltransferase
VAIRRIGLLGGSFNPAHDGHVYISREALKRLRLNEVWWMVSPQNPLKSVEGMAPFSERVRVAKSVARTPRMRVIDIEQKLGTVHTAATLRALLPRYRRCRFVWLMGADNLLQIGSWKDWQQIFESLPVAVFDRPPYSRRAVSGKAATVYADARIGEKAAVSLALRQEPAWVFLRHRPHSGSATAIRRSRGDTMHAADAASSR